MGWCRCCGVAASEKKVEEVPDTWRRLQTQHYNGGLELMYYFKNIVYKYLIKIQLSYKDLTNYHEFIMLENNKLFVSLRLILCGGFKRARSHRGFCKNSHKGVGNLFFMYARINHVA